MATITSRVARVRTKLGNRTDLDTRIADWLGDAYLELGMAIPFEELFSFATTICTTGKVGGVDDIYNYPVNVRGIRSLTLVRTDGKTTSPIIRRSIRLIDRYSVGSAGPPAIYTPWSVQAAVGPPVVVYARQIIVRPIPDLAYTIRWRTWLKPVLAVAVGDTILSLPDDWLEILDYSAALRGFNELLQFDKALATHTILFGGTVGTPDTGFKRVPGLIKERMTAMQAEVGDEEYAYRPPLRRYTAA